MAGNGREWAFVLGMVVYGIDGAIFLVVQDWIGVGFHAFALFMIFRGYQAARHSQRHSLLQTFGRS